MNAGVEKILPSGGCHVIYTTVSNCYACSISSFLLPETDPKSVGAVAIKGQSPIECTMLVMGVGVGPATQFLADSGFSLEKDKGIAVDEYLKVEGYDGRIFAVSKEG